MRFTKNSKPFFDNVRYGTCIESVRYGEGSEKFAVNLSGKEEGKSLSSFGICIWAAGENGWPHVSSRINGILKSDGFRGR